MDNFSFATVEVRDPNPGEVLVRNVCISVDPYMRGRMNDAKSYIPPFQIGQPLEGGAIGRVIASQDEKLHVGSYVQSICGWREAFVAPAASLQIVDTTAAPPSAYLGILGVTGLTAWVGLYRIANLKIGETIFVAGALIFAGSRFAKWPLMMHFRQALWSCLPTFRITGHEQQHPTYAGSPPRCDDGNSP